MLRGFKSLGTKEHVENLENIWFNLSYQCKNKGSGRGGALTEEMRPGPRHRPAGPKQSGLLAPRGATSNISFCPLVGAVAWAWGIPPSPYGERSILWHKVVHKDDSCMIPEQGLSEAVEPINFCLKHPDVFWSFPPGCSENQRNGIKMCVSGFCSHTLGLLLPLWPYPVWTDSFLYTGFTYNIHLTKGFCFVINFQRIKNTQGER